MLQRGRTKTDLHSASKSYHNHIRNCGFIFTFCMQLWPSNRTKTTVFEPTPTIRYKLIDRQFVKIHPKIIGRQSQVYYLLTHRLVSVFAMLAKLRKIVGSGWCWRWAYNCTKPLHRSLITASALCDQRLLSDSSILCMAIQRPSSASKIFRGGDCTVSCSLRPYYLSRLLGPIRGVAAASGSLPFGLNSTSATSAGIAKKTAVPEKRVCLHNAIIAFEFCKSHWNVLNLLNNWAFK